MRTPVGAWRSLVARSVRDAEVGGSNPLAPTSPASAFRRCLSLRPAVGQHPHVTSRLPALGPRGEGWVLGQMALFAVILVAGVRDLAGSGSGSPWGTVALVAGVVAIAIGGVVVAWSVRTLRAALSPFPRPVSDAPLIQSGPYRLIRHPIYSGLVLGAIGWGLVTGSVLAIAAAGLLFLLLVGKSMREEAWLAAEHPAYGAYQQLTKRFIPWVY
jgi:protein-S-isoprenylcysteine O-methyltransferase Ste14